MAEIINIIPLNPTTFEFQEYSVNDTSLITSVEVENSFDPTTDHIEYFIYNLNGSILTSNVSGYNGYRLLDNVLTIYPEIDLTTQGYTEGQYNTLYNFLSNKLSSNSNNNYFISEISPDRTEVRLDTTFIPNVLVISSSMELMNDIATSTGSYYDFYLNFGDNQLIIANNILLDTSSINNPTVLIKLYDALPQQFDINSQCWVVTQVAAPVAYNISITQTFDVTDNHIYLKGPNTSLNIKNQINNSTDYSNFNQLSVTDSTQGSGSLRYQLNSLLSKTGIEINVDYSNYNNFIHFSSAQTRLENFYYKLSLIEQYNYSASYSSTTSANYYVSSSNVVWQSKINEIITGFDNYEYFLYFDSGSACWPKTGNTPPYTNYSVTSIEGQAFLVSQSAVAEEYDIENNNALINAIPSYLLEDPANAQYELFIEMIGQHFDNVFLYTQDVTNKYNNDNRLNYGVSKDLVADILRDMGVKIYQNNFSTNDLYSALLGLTPSGSLYNLPYTTGSLPTPAGYEYINTYITASSTSSLIPTEDLNAEIYKRIYANLPYLLKKKGTVEGLRALITTYGIPDTILQVHEFGGQDKIIENDYDLWFDQYNYAFDTLGTNYVTSSFQLNSSWSSNTPNAVEVRFQTRGIPSNTGYYSQSIWVTNESTALRLRYTGSAYTSGSYSGSIPNPYNEFALLEFIPDTSDLNITASVYLPFLDGEWWSVIVNKTSAEDYTLIAANKNYQGEDGNYIGFQASSSVNSTSDSWDISSNFYLGYNGGSTLGKVFSGSFQELRFYTTPLSQSGFDDYVMNPYSIDSNGINTAPDTLAFRATLGGELYTSSISIHPKVTGSWVTTQSFTGTSTFKFNTTPVFVPNTEIIYLNQFPAGIKNRVSNKIRQQAEILPYSGSEETNLPTNQVLSPFISVQQSVAVSGSYTPNIDYVEIAFSPQNEINNDIAGQLGYFNIGEYIGDPRLVSSSAESYPALDAIRDYYFEKYTSNYNIWDYVRLIKYFDNSLFKMIADWTPARTDLASGIVIKQTTLERNKYPVPQPNITSSIANIGSGSTNIPYQTENIYITGSPIQMVKITGSDGGSFNSMMNVQNYFYFYTSSIILSGSNDNLYTVNLPAPGDYLIKVIATNEPGATYFNIYDGNQLTGNNIFNDYNTDFNVYISASLEYDYLTFENVLGSSGENLTIESLSIQSLNQNTTAVNQVWTGSTPSLSGSVLFTESTQEEFYNGELSGSIITVENGNLNDCIVIETLEYQQSGISLGTQDINYKFLDDQSYYLVIKATNNTGQSNAGFFISNTYNSAQRYFTSPYIPSGGTYEVTLLINNNVVDINSTLNVLQTPYVSFQPFFSAGSGFDVTASVYQNYIEPDCLVLAGNIDVQRVNNEFFDVDFSTNAITAVNASVIISASRGTGSATPSTVPASNYTTARITNPRYNGCKLTSPNINIGTGSQLPNIEQYGKFALYYKGATNPDNFYPGNSTIFNLRLMVDDEGNIYQPKATSSYYWNGLDSFGKDEIVNITVQDSSSVSQTTLTAVQGENTVYIPFEYLNSPLMTASGSGYDVWDFNSTTTSSIVLNDTVNNQSVILSQGPWWATASVATVLTSSLASLGGFFISNSINPQYYQYGESISAGIARDGFDTPISTINPIPGDIFYVSSSQYASTVISTSINLITDDFYVYLDSPVAFTNSQTLNKFVIVRPYQNLNRIVLNINLSGSNPQVGSGFIFTQKSTNLFKDNLGTIVADLTAKNLI